MDRFAHYDWPFFEPRHGALAREADAWAAGLEYAHGDDADGVCRRLVQDLGKAGYLKHCAPGGGEFDVRSIAPFDGKTVIDSVKKTGHCIVADNDWVHCGFSAEVAATVYEACLREIKSPIKRIGFSAAPCPCTRPLENEFYTNAVDIIRAIEATLGLSPTDLAGEDFYSYENKFKGPF